MKVGWILFLLATVSFAIWSFFFLGPIDEGPLMVAIFLFFFLHPWGALWMLFQSIRYENNPWPYVVLCGIPYSFVWYYFTRHAERQKRG
jgi:hypothetical protein